MGDRVRSLAGGWGAWELTDPETSTRFCGGAFDKIILQLEDDVPACFLKPFHGVDGGEIGELGPR